MNPLEFLGEFQAEAVEKLDIIAHQLLRLERDATNAQPVREMFLAAHTVKGGAAMLRLTDVEALAHALEDLLTTLRDQASGLNPTTADLLFQTIDMLRMLVASASAEAIGADLDPKVDAFVTRLRQSPMAPAAPATEAAGGAELAARRALVVDDSTTVRELQRTLLEGAGYEVDILAAGDKALSRALQSRYAVVIAGLELSGLHGLELATAVRAAPGYATVPIVLLSSDADEVLAARAEQAGATALLRKSGARDKQLLKLLSALLS